MARREEEPISEGRIRETKGRDETKKKNKKKNLWSVLFP